MLRQRVDDAAPEDVTEHLVTGLGKRYGFGVTLGLLLVHAPSFGRRTCLRLRSFPRRNLSGCTFWCKPFVFPGGGLRDYVYRQHLHELDRGSRRPSRWPCQSMMKCTTTRAPNGSRRCCAPWRSASASSTGTASSWGEVPSSSG